MVGATATATEMKNNFGKYLGIVLRGEEVIVTKNGVEVGRFIPTGSAVSFLTDSLAGIIKGEHEQKDARQEALNKKYGFAD